VLFVAGLIVFQQSLELSAATSHSLSNGRCCLNLALYRVEFGANPLKVYPPTGGAIDSLAVNAAFTVPVGRTECFFYTSTVSSQSAQISPTPGFTDNYVTAGLVRKQSHPTLPLEIFNYAERVQYEKLWDDVTRQCRGLVMHGDKVVARPFAKFFNDTEHAPEEIPWHLSCEVTEKMDGSPSAVLYVCTIAFARTSLADSKRSRASSRAS